MDYRPHSAQMYSTTMKSLQDCALMCEHMTLRVYEMPDAGTRKMQLHLLRDCADICELCMKYMARHSGFSKSLCHFCAYVCDTCGNECLSHADQESKMCGQMCLKCAEDCRNFAATH